KLREGHQFAGRAVETGSAHRRIQQIRGPVCPIRQKCRTHKESDILGASSVRETETDRANDAMAIAAIERGGVRAELLVFRAAMNIPGAVLRARSERNSQNTAHAQEAKRLVDSIDLVVVAETQADFDWNGNARFRERNARSNSGLEICSGLESRIRLANTR